MKRKERTDITFEVETGSIVASCRVSSGSKGALFKLAGTLGMKPGIEIYLSRYELLELRQLFEAALAELPDDA